MFPRAIALETALREISSRRANSAFGMISIFLLIFIYSYQQHLPIIRFIKSEISQIQMPGHTTTRYPPKSPEEPTTSNSHCPHIMHSHGHNPHSLAKHRSWSSLPSLYELLQLCIGQSQNLISLSSRECSL